MVPEVFKSDAKELGDVYLFGSRSMAGRSTNLIDISPSTDWDFSAQHSEHAHYYLISAGYYYFTNNYCDDLTTGVYVKSFVDYSISTDIISINVVLHSDEQLFRHVWNLIEPDFYYNHLWKRSPSYKYRENTEVRINITEIMNQLYRRV
jgi:hypothetical protein